jgi:cytochrome c oxidase subunit II
MAASEAPTAPAPAEPRHGLRILLIWLVLSLAADLVIWFAWYPHMPPGRMSDSASGQQFDTAVLALMGAPVVLAIWVYFGYALVVWRQRPGDDSDGPPIHGNARISAAWIITTSAIVLGAFAFGTYELVVPAGAGTGQGPQPIWKLAGANTPAWAPGSGEMLRVQVIGQQWKFSYRYPQFGGMESAQLVLPKDTPLEFHVTSIDVIHSFWAYQLGVKADANPGVDNVAYTTATHLGGFTVRCNELCGFWHGAMFDYGRVVSQTEFNDWAGKMESKEQSTQLLAALPAYAPTYDPTVVPQLGKDLVKVADITGANGYYYPGPQAGTPGDPVSP